MDIAIPERLVVDNYAAAPRRLRIAFVTETYPPEVNGAALSAARVVEGLRRRHHEVQVIRPQQGESDAGEEGERFEDLLTHGLPIPGYANLRMGLPCKRRLMRLWSMERPDVVHLATEGPLCWSALQAAQALGLPVSSDFRTNFHAYSRYYGLAWLHRPIKAYLRAFHNRVQCTMVPTESLRRELSQGGFQNLVVVSRGVDTQRFSPIHRSEPLRASWGVEARDTVAIYVGRVAAEKNLEALVAAFEGIRQADARARLVVVGDGPLRTELQARYPAILFAGQRTGDDLAAHYASADLFLFPSLTETFGNVTAEAMASGLPVVAFDYAGAAQLIRSREEGTLVPCAETQAFVQCAVELAADGERRRLIGQRAREVALKLDWDDVVLRFESVLCAVMGAGSPTVASAYPAAVRPGA